jgi:hypothetical protein
MEASVLFLEPGYDTRGITMHICAALSPKSFFYNSNHTTSEASTPTFRGEAFETELGKRSQV